ncbi:MAG: AAA family ATPase [Planctomycetota bacterium]
MSPVFGMGMGASPDAERLAGVLAGGRRCVRVATLEEAEALGVVGEASQRLKARLWLWSHTDGLHDPRLDRRTGMGVGAGDSPFDATKTMKPEIALAAMLSESRLHELSVFVVLDLLAHLDEPLVARAARDLVHRCDATGAAAGPWLVLVDHQSHAPAWLEAHSTAFELSLPDDEELERIARATLREVDQSQRIEIKIQKSSWSAILRALVGLPRRRVRELVRDAVASDRSLTDDDLEQVIESKRELLAASGALEFVRAPTSLDALGGLEGLKAWLAARSGAFDDDAHEWGLTPPRGVLLLGVQGAGKSLCAKAIATAWKRPLLRLDAGALYDKFIGESERRLRDALRQAERMAPVVLWIDEIEKAFAGAGAQSSDGGLSKRMFGTLLTWMQEHREPVFLVATANDIQALPPELMRKGRFDEIFFVDLPSAAARRAIARIHLGKRLDGKAGDLREIDLDKIVEASDGYSGAEIEQGVVSALHGAFRERRALATDDVVAALQASPPLSVTRREGVEQLRAWAKGRCMPAG